MPITELDRKDIEETAIFLEKRGYIKTENLYSINYTLNNICISIIYPPNSEESDVNIRFIDANQVFSVGWISLVRENIKGSDEKLTNAKELLKYMEYNFLEITNYQFCLESNKLIEKYVETHHEKFESAVSNFLEKQ